MVRFLINLLFSFILMMLLVFTGLTFVTSSTFLNSDYYAKSLNKAGYYDLLKVEIEQGFVSLGQATGLPKEVFQNSVDKGWLETEGNRYISSLINYLTGKSNQIGYELNSAPLEKSLQANINNYAKQIGVTISKDGQSSIDNLIKRSTGAVRNELVIVDLKGGSLQSVRKYITTAYNYRYLLIIAEILWLILMFLYNSTRTKEYYRWVAYSLMASGLFLLVPSSLVLISAIFDRLALSNIYLRQAVSAVINGFFSYLLIAGLISVVLGVLLLTLTQRVRSIRTTRSTRT